MTKKVGKVVQRKKPIKGSGERVLKKLVDYLKTDCYLFAPFISPSSESSIGGVEQIESRRKNCRTLLKKIEEYLKSNSYMYGPYVIAPSSTATSKGSVAYTKRVTLTVNAKEREFFEEPSKEGGLPNSPEFISSDRQTSVHKETVNHVIYDNCLSLSLPGHIFWCRNPFYIRKKTCIICGFCTDEEKVDSRIKKIKKLESRIRKIAVD